MANSRSTALNFQTFLPLLNPINVSTFQFEETWVENNFFSFAYLLGRKFRKHGWETMFPAIVCLYL